MCFTVESHRHRPADYTAVVAGEIENDASTSTYTAKKMAAFYARHRPPVNPATVTNLLGEHYYSFGVFDVVKRWCVRTLLVCVSADTHKCKCHKSSAIVHVCGSPVFPTRPYILLLCANWLQLQSGVNYQFSYIKFWSVRPPVFWCSSNVTGTTCRHVLTKSCFRFWITV